MKKHRSLSFILAAILGITWLAGCQQSSQATPGVATFPTSAPASPTVVVNESIPAATPRPTPEASPLSIAAMRAKVYPGSDLAIERTLPSGPNFSRYVTSYDSDGLRLHGLLTVPSGDKPAGGWPVILLNHGYIPPAEYSTEQSYAQIVAAFAQSGYIVFKPDYRGNGTSPGTPTQVYISPDYVSDSLSALASLKKYPDANPDRIGVWGHSMGGNITLHELVISHDVKAAALMAGVVGSYSDILDWWRARVASGVLTTENDQQAERLVEQMVNFYGTPQTNPDYWNSIDPTFFVADVQSPVLIQVGTNDTVVPPSFSRELANRLQQAGKNVNFHVYPGADHNLAPDTAAAVREAIAFFDQYLK